VEKFTIYKDKPCQIFESNESIVTTVLAYHTEHSRQCMGVQKSCERRQCLPGTRHLYCVVVGVWIVEFDDSAVLALTNARNSATALEEDRIGFCWTCQDNLAAPVLQVQPTVLVDRQQENFNIAIHTSIPSMGLVAGKRPVESLYKLPLDVSIVSRHVRLALESE
jgi:hypothetical protein